MDMKTEDLIKVIIQCAYNVRTHLAAGFLESVYQKALLIELRETSNPQLSSSASFLRLNVLSSLN